MSYEINGLPDYLKYQAERANEPEKEGSPADIHFLDARDSTGPENRLEWLAGADTALRHGIHRDNGPGFHSVAIDRVLAQIRKCTAATAARNETVVMPAAHLPDQAALLAVGYLPSHAEITMETSTELRMATKRVFRDPLSAPTTSD